MSYVEQPLGSPELFRCAWAREAGSRGTALVLPDACADVVVDRSGRGVLVGPTMDPRRHALAGSVVFRGLRLQPWSVPLLFGRPAGELRDQVVPIAALLPRPLAECVAESVWDGEIPSCWSRVDASPWQIRLVRGLLDAPSRQLQEVSRADGVSPRHARRSSRHLTGLSPSELARVGRLHRFLPALDRGEEGLAALAAGHGYADQSHLSREVRRLAGTTPTELRRERGSAGPAAGRSLVRGTADLET